MTEDTTAKVLPQAIGDCTLHLGDALTVLQSLPTSSVHCCITSPPYWGLRDYGVAGQLGLEPSPAEYVANMVAVFREVRRVLRDDGTLWLNLGDSYSAPNGRSGGHTYDSKGPQSQLAHMTEAQDAGIKKDFSSIPAKNLIGIPWRVAFALQADGWYLRQDIIWAKPNPMPESVTDRCTKAHEYLFLLAKNERYYFNADAIAERAINAGRVVAYDGSQKNCETADDPHFATRITSDRLVADTRNKRSVWTVATQPYSEAHFATFPPKLIEPCVLAGCPTGGTVLDCFGGAGTTGFVAQQLGRKSILIELNPDYHPMIVSRLRQDSLAFV